MPAYTNDSRDGGGRRQLVGALVLFVVAVSTAFLPTPTQRQIAAAIRESVLRPFVILQEGVAVARNRSVDSQGLRRQLDSLVAVTTGHMTLADENRRLRALLQLRERIGSGWITANVVRPATTGSESLFLLDIGSQQGVERYAPVITGQGLVGVVQEVFPTSSTAIDWTHPDFRVSAMDTEGTVYGIVRSRRGQFREEDRLEFDGTAFQSNLQEGTAVVTSNLSGIWPRGVPIGKLEGLAEADAGWRKSYWLRPMVEVGSVTHVLVGVSPERDLYGAWPVDSIVTDAELALQIQARADSLQLLRTVLAAARPLRDSVIAALLLGDPGVMPVLPADSGVGGTPGAGAARGLGGGRAQPSRASGAPAGGQPPPSGQAAPPAGDSAAQPQRGGQLPPPRNPGDTTTRPRTDTLGSPARPDSGAPPRPRPDTLGIASAPVAVKGGTTVEGSGAAAVRIGKGGAPRR
jgi:rod shape-determining protein MreC